MHVHSKFVIKCLRGACRRTAVPMLRLLLAVLPFVIFMVINLLLLSTLSTLSDSLRLNARCWAVSVSRLSIVVRIPLPWIRLPVFRSSSRLAKHFCVPPVRRFALPLDHRGRRHRLTNRATLLPLTSLGSLLSEQSRPAINFGPRPVVCRPAVQDILSQVRHRTLLCCAHLHSS